MRTRAIILMAALTIISLSTFSCKSDTPWKDDIADVTAGNGTEENGDNQESGTGGSDTQGGGESTGEENQGEGESLPDTGEITTDNPDETVFTDIDPWTGPVADDKAADTKGTDSDIYWEANTWTNVVTVTFDGLTATVTKSTPAILAYVDGAHVTIDFQTNTLSNVSIVAKGKSPDGSLKIYGAKKSRLALCGLDLTSSKGPAINIQSHKRVFVHLPAGSVNRVTDAATYSADSYYISGATSATEDRKAAFFSEANLIFSGTGCLVVNGKYKHALCTDGYLYTRPGVTLAATGAAANCFHAKGDDEELFGVKIQGGCLYARATELDGKCLKADMSIIVNGGKLDFQADGQAGKGIKSDADVTINAGKLNIKTTGAAYYDSSVSDVSSACCIKSDGDLSILGGELDLSSTGQAGKGIKAGSDDIAGKNIIIGTAQGGPVMKIATTGTSYGSSSSGPGGGRPGQGGSTNASSGSSKPKAVKASGTITVRGGDLAITTTGSGGEGMESKSATVNSILLEGGNIYLNTYDDGINSAGQIVIDGANVFVWATGNDAVDSNYGKTGSLLIKSGSLFAHSSTEEALDCDSASRVTISGGTLFTTAGSSMSSGSPSCSVPVVKLSSLAATVGYFTLTDSSGNVIFSTYVPKSMTSRGTYIAAPSLVSGSTYKYGMSGTSAPSGSASVFGTYYYTGGTASVSNSFTATSSLLSK
ncbi:MAG: carbohydrate-binding domain-containing protein [Candidatus Cryptobacteroides sp.]